MYSAIRLLRGFAGVCVRCADELENRAHPPALPAERAEWGGGRMEQRRASWELAVQSFLVVGELTGFGEVPMAKAGITRRTRKAFVAVLQQAGVLVVIPKTGTFYALRADGRSWHAQAVRRALKSGRLNLPCPTDADPPPLWRVAVAQRSQRSLSARSARRLEKP